MRTPHPSIKRIATLTLAFFIAMMWRTASAQGRSYIREQIKAEGECRNVAITKTNGDLMLYGRNGCARSGCPESLNDAITQLNEDREFIDDVVLTEEGRWLILYGNNGFLWNDIPYSMEKALRNYNENKEVVTSAVFNDAGDWVIVTTEHFSSSDTRIRSWLKDGLAEYGQLWTVCLTDDCLIAVYANGFKSIGEIPNDLFSALKKSKIDVYRLKIAGDAWFFADEDGTYHYNM